MYIQKSKGRDSLDCHPDMSSRSTVSRRSEPSSRALLIGEQPNPWDLLQPQDRTSRHRGAKPPRRCGLLEEISLLSPGELLFDVVHSATRSEQVTKPCFRTCSTCRSRSQAGICLCTYSLVSIETKPTLGRLGYTLRGNRPS